VNSASSGRGAVCQFFMDEEKRHHGLQLAGAVILAYATSRLVGLPEHFWAVMSAQIVMRPNSGGTLVAGWDRARATVVGVMSGLFGVWLQQIGVNVIASTLAIVAMLSFASAASPALRSAPIAALIILAAGDLPGHSALQAAVLRVVQIAIGIGVAMGVALVSSRYRAPARFSRGCAALLHRMARQLQMPGARARTSEADAESRPQRCEVRSIGCQYLRATRTVNRACSFARANQSMSKFTIASPDWSAGSSRTPMS